MQVVIAGAGVIGCAIAHELASRGAAVRVIDMRGTGQGATRASAGVLAPYIEGHIGPLLALGLSSLERYDDFVARVRADSGLPIEYQRTGTLEVARNAKEAATLEARAQVLAHSGVAHTLLDGTGARRAEPSLGGCVTAALLVPAHGYVGATALTSALAASATRHGAQLAAGNIRSIESTSGGVRIMTSAEVFDADAVVIAAGSWAGQLPTPTPAPVRPVRGQLLHLRLPRPAASRVIWGTACYMVPWQDGSLLVGATVEDVGFDEAATAAGVGQLLDAGRELLPVAGTARFDEVRVGLRPATPDELPLIGPSSTMRGVFYAAGHYRNGVLLAPLTASLVADLVLLGRETSELAVVQPARFGL